MMRWWCFDVGISVHMNSPIPFIDGSGVQMLDENQFILKVALVKESSFVGLGYERDNLGIERDALVFTHENRFRNKECVDGLCEQHLPKSFLHNKPT